MQWKLILKTSLLVGVILIAGNFFGVIYSFGKFYGLAPVLELLLFVSIYAFSIVLTFSFIYRRTTKRRVLQASLASVFSVVFGYAFSVVIVFALLGFS